MIGNRDGWLVGIYELASESSLVSDDIIIVVFRASLTEWHAHTYKSLLLFLLLLLYSILFDLTLPPYVARFFILYMFVASCGAESDYENSLFAFLCGCRRGAGYLPLL